MTPVRGIAAGLFWVLAIGACSSGGTEQGTLAALEDEATSAPISEPSSSSTAVSASEVPTTAAELATTEVSEGPTSESTETTLAEVCPTSELPSGPSTTPAAVDVDADGLPDTAYMVQTSAGWQAVVEFGGGGATVAALSGTNDFDQPFVIGDADLDGDGVNELAVSMGVGAYVGLVGFVRVRDCDIVQLAFEDSSPAVFATGASVGGGEALICNGDGTIDVYFFTLFPGSDAGSPEAEYESGWAPYRMEGDIVVAYPGDGAVLSGADVAEIDLLDCLGLELVL